MAYQAGKTTQNKSIANSQNVTQRRESSTMQFADNRQSTIVQKKAQKAADSSTQVMQLKASTHMANTGTTIQRKQEDRPNRTGLPDNLKAGIESLSGMSMDHVKVHYNSSQPAALQAHAYAQGSDIHVAPGQERHLPHEAWHVVQQKQGRVRPTMQLKGKVNVNDDNGLEREADIMGAKALSS